MKRAALYRERPKLEHACSHGGFSGEEYVITLAAGSGNAAAGGATFWPKRSLALW